MLFNFLIYIFTINQKLKIKEMQRNRYIILIYLFLFLKFSLITNAQKDSINLDSLVTMPFKDFLELTVTGVSKYEETSKKTPASVIIINEAQIRENCYQDLSDVLKDIIGIDIVDNARGFGEFYTLRGVEGNDRFLVLIDGQKINPVSGTFLSIGNSISVKYVKRIEIIFGPSSVMYGADAFSGIINIISKEVENKHLVSSNIDYGSRNTINGELTTQFKINKNLSFSAFARVFYSDGIDLVGRDPVYDLITQYHYPQRNEFEQPINDHTLFLKTKYKNFTLSYFRQHFDEGNALGQQTRSVIYNKECKWKMDNNVIWANYNKQIDSIRNISFNIAYINHSQDPESQFYKWDKDAILEKAFSQYMTGLDNTFRSSLTYHRTFFKQKNLKLITGIEYKYTSSIPPYANDQVLARSDKFEGETAEIIKKELYLTEQRFAGFAQITYSPHKSISFILGGRYDYSLRYKETFNPRMSFVFTPFQNTAFKFIYGTAFQAPSLFYQYEQWGSVTAVMLSADEIKSTEPGWALQNQKITTFEAKISQRITKTFVLHITGYHNFLTNLIERKIYTNSAYNKYFSTPENAHYSIGLRNENIGEQSINGMDIKTEISLENNFYGYISYSYINAFSKKETGKEKIPRIANHKLWFGFIYTNLFKYFNISARLKIIGKINNRNITVFPDGTQPGYINMDVSLRVPNLIKSVAFYIRLENIFNSKYEHGGLLDQVIYLPTIPQPGFAGRVGLEIQI